MQAPLTLGLKPFDKEKPDHLKFKCYSLKQLSSSLWCCVRSFIYLARVK